MPRATVIAYLGGALIWGHDLVRDPGLARRVSARAYLGAGITLGGLARSLLRR